MSMQSVLFDRQYRCVSASMTIPISQLSIDNFSFVCLSICLVRWIAKERKHSAHLKEQFAVDATVRMISAKDAQTNKQVYTSWSKNSQLRQCSEKLTIIDWDKERQRRRLWARHQIGINLQVNKSVSSCYFLGAKLQSWSQWGLQYCTRRENNALQTVILDCHRNEHHCNVLWTLWRCWRCIGKGKRKRNCQMLPVASKDRAWPTAALTVNQQMSPSAVAVPRLLHDHHWSYITHYYKRSFFVVLPNKTHKLFAIYTTFILYKN